MRQLDIVIQNPTGLHARPAKVFVNTAKQFQSDIRVTHGPKTANAKSLISMLTLGVECGSEVRIVVDGADEDLAMDALETAVIGGLGEEQLVQEAASSPTPAPPEPVRNRQAAAGTSDGNIIRGVPAAPGIAIGPIFRFTHTQIEINETFSSAVEEEERLRRARAGARDELQQLHQQMLAQNVDDEAAIFEVHLELLDDPDLLEDVQGYVEQKRSAAQAWQATIDARAARMADLSNPLLAARAADLRDVGDRVLRLLVGANAQASRLPDHPVILVAHDLTPSDTAALDRDKVIGFCTAAGGPTAHSAIIARALGLPAVVGAGAGVLDLEDKTRVILHGEAGTLTIRPDETAVAEARAAQETWHAQRAAAAAAAADPATTRDGRRIEVAANVGGVADAQKAMSTGAEGIGLLRTEFLFLERATAPSEDEQVSVYSNIAQAMQGRPVIVRTLDIGGDKPLPYINLDPEENPFLGERGIRLCLNRPELLRQQVRAILRAAANGRLRIMFPMVSDVAEWRDARALVEEVHRELGSAPVELGIMIEVPSAALMADAFAPEVDFFSIGTNDLTQYTLALDRTHPTLAGRADGLHPAVLRLIKQTVDASHAAGKWTGVCGELGSDPQAVPILVGLGVDELSVSVPNVPSVKAQIRNLELSRAQTLAEAALRCATSQDVRQLVQEHT